MFYEYTKGKKRAMYNVLICSENEDFAGWLKDEFVSGIKYNPEKFNLRIEKSLDIEQMDRLDAIIFDTDYIDKKINNLDDYSFGINEGILLIIASENMLPKPEYFKLNIYRYIMKTSGAQEIQEYISEILEKIVYRCENEIIEIASDGKAHRVFIKDLLYINRKKRGSVFKLETVDENKKTYIEIDSNEKIDDWYIKLKDKGFEYAHNSYIVNLKKIMKLDKGEVILANGEKIYVSRSHSRKFNEEFSKYFSKK